MVEFTVLGAFLLGLAHTLEPCEDKVVVSFLTIWGSERWKQGIMLVILYGLAIAIINTLLVIIFYIVGGEHIENLEIYFVIIAAIVMIIFGIIILWGKHLPHLVHLTHHHPDGKEEKGRKEGKFPEKKRVGTVLLLGMIRGIPYCPIEIAVVLWALSIGNILAGAIVMFVFGLGTTIGLIPIGIIMGGIAQKAKKTKYKKYIPTICGLVFIIFGILLLIMHILGVGH